MIAISPLRGGRRVAVLDINTVETTSPEIGMHIDGKYAVRAQ